MLLPLLHVFALTLPPVAALPAAVPAASAPTSQSLAASAPTLWFSLPSSGAELDPVILIGRDFGNGALPFFGFIPSVPLFTFNTPELPVLGSLSLMVTAVPFTFFPGRVDLTVVSGFQSSNAIDFTVL